MLPNMKNLFFWALLFFSPCIFAQSEESTLPAFDYKRDFKNILARTKNKHDTLFYLKLLTRFQENDSSLTPAETLALMIGYTESRFFKPYANMQTELEIIKLNDKGYYLDALDESKEYLRTHPLSLSINKERSYAYHMLKKKDSARFFMRLADKIMEAMIYSGKGRTPETAFFSLGLVDGDYFIPNVGLSVWGKKTDVDKHRNYLYVIDAVSLEDVHKTYYFNIQHAKQKMDLEEDTEQLAKEKKPKKKRGFYDPSAVHPDSLPPNPADSIVLPISERPKIVIDSAKIRDSIMRARNRADSLRYDSIFIACKADSIQQAADQEREKAMVDSATKMEQIRETLNSARKGVIFEKRTDSSRSQNGEQNQIMVDSTSASIPIEKAATDSLAPAPTMQISAREMKAEDSVSSLNPSTVSKDPDIQRQDSSFMPVNRADSITSEISPTVENKDSENNTPLNGIDTLQPISSEQAPEKNKEKQEETNQIELPQTEKNSESPTKEEEKQTEQIINPSVSPN